MKRWQVENANAFSPAQEQVVTVDQEATQLFEKLNPVLSNGHRVNVITQLVNKSVPREVADVIAQLVVNIPHDNKNKGYTDEQIRQMIVSRHYQNEIELEEVRKSLDAVLGDMFPDEPAPQEPTPPSDPKPE
ncbi:hypothetical protein [Segatella maculosa]|uniref:hypothetical protein n=1 Tax=Segatella maculosa TaxID=439703 RepID=UPI0028D67F83|nr:hypothetical protein [Segatella maculosa]